MVAFRSSNCSETIWVTLAEDNGFNPSTNNSLAPVGFSNGSFRVLKFQEGDITCSISNEATMAFNISLTDLETLSCLASGAAIRLVNCACSLPSQSRVQ